MKSTSIKYILAAAGALGLASCSKWLDINENPLATQTVDPGYVFNFAAISNSTSRQGGDSFIPVVIGGQLMADGGTEGGDWEEALYVFSEYSYGNSWVGWYSNTLENLKSAAAIAERKGDANTVAQCETFMALAFYQLTMLYGDVPFSQALDIEKYPEPEFDTQKRVLEGCLELLDHALSVATADGAGAIGRYDIFFGGDMTRWIKAAKSLKLQILLTLYNREPERAAQIAELVGQGGFPQSGADDWKFPFFAASGSENPNWKLAQRYVSDFIEDPDPARNSNSFYLFFAHNSVLDPMKEYADPRMPIYFYANAEGEYMGIETGEISPKKEVTLPSGRTGSLYLASPINSKRFFTAGMPDVLLSFQEAQFNLAEVYLKGIGVAKDPAKARQALLAGVEASCVFWGVPQAEAAAFAAGLPEFYSLSEAQSLVLLNNQRRIDFMSRPLEAFNNQRRTNIPALTTPGTAQIFAPALFSRFQYPSREYAPNPNVPKPFPLFYNPVWFQN